MKVATFFRAVVAIMGSLTHVGAVCTGGIVGVESTSQDVCCVEECGMCGGPGCSHSGNSTLTANDCCVTEIMESDVLCDVSGVAPCILTAADTNSTCSNGLAGVEDNSICCDSACGLCGGEGCGNIPGLSGDDCCSTTIASNGTLCSEAGSAPCIIDVASADTNSTCSNGLAGIEDNGVCCDSACGLCGGEGCGNIPGLSGDDCCSKKIASNGTLCSEAESAPCIIDVELTVSNSTCSNGLSGIQDVGSLSGACCISACGQCGGEGCGNIPGLTSDDCCSGAIASNGTLCSIAEEAPCIIDPPDVNSSTCPNGFAGVQDDSVCCAEACNLVCGGEGCGTIYGTKGASDCCSGTILAAGVFCVEGIVAPCIMVNGTYTPAPSVILKTSSPTVTPRVVHFTSRPTMEGETMAPSATMAPIPNPTTAPFQPTGDPTAAPTTPEPTIISIPANTDDSGSVAPTGTPTGARTPNGNDNVSGAATVSMGNLVAFTALVTGTLAMFAAARN